MQVHCEHGLVQLKKLGTRVNSDGLEVCLGCNKPTWDSLLRARDLVRSQYGSGGQPGREQSVHHPQAHDGVTIFCPECERPVAAPDLDWHRSLAHRATRAAAGPQSAATASSNLSGAGRATGRSNDSEREQGLTERVAEMPRLTGSVAGVLATYGYPTGAGGSSRGGVKVPVALEVDEVFRMCTPRLRDLLPGMKKRDIALTLYIAACASLDDVSHKDFRWLDPIFVDWVLPLSNSYPKTFREIAESWRLSGFGLVPSSVEDAARETVRAIQDDCDTSEQRQALVDGLRVVSLATLCRRGWPSLESIQQIQKVWDAWSECVEISRANDAEKIAANSRQLGETLSAVNAMVGLDQVKVHLTSLVNHLQLHKERIDAGLKVGNGLRNLVFAGSPGTGKTSVARAISDVYAKLGLLAKGHLIESDRASLVAGYLGQTALKTTEVVQSALGGVLFVDEAYSLVADEQDSFGREALSTLVKLIEDHRDNLVVILAGYPSEMQRLIATNPGLESRFSAAWLFEDYTPEQLLMILESMAARDGYRIAEEARPGLLARFELDVRQTGFGNARGVRNLYEAALVNQSNRLIGLSSRTREQLATLISGDFGPPPGF